VPVSGLYHRGGGGAQGTRDYIATVLAGLPEGPPSPFQAMADRPPAGAVVGADPPRRGRLPSFAPGRASEGLNDLDAERRGRGHRVVGGCRVLVEVLSLQPCQVSAQVQSARKVRRGPMTTTTLATVGRNEGQAPPQRMLADHVTAVLSLHPPAIVFPLSGDHHRGGHFRAAADLHEHTYGTRGARYQSLIGCAHSADKALQVEGPDASLCILV